ncbi:hypothetical protein [Sphingomonas sp.]|uniref:hypothetical protein n=1 Tax=Sphingomonas sp. TaxID=28214 RepID=UPI002DD6AD33|nr:hypothetical protein [Sphingomonas sp.]
MMLTLLLSAGLQVETPKTVNGAELGSIAEFQDHGAARICLQTAAIDLIEGETAVLQYAGIHAATLRITSKRGILDIRHGDAWARPRGMRQIVSRRDGQTIRRQETDGAVGYVLYAVTEYSRRKQVPVLMIGGSALRGLRDDLAILARIDVSTREPALCDRTYTYGWDMVLGEEPVSRKARQ